MFSKYPTHYLCSPCQTWHHREGGNICPDCNRPMRDSPRDPRMKERFRAKYPLHKESNIKE